MNWFKKLKDGLGKSTSKVTASLSSLSSLFGGARIDAGSLEEVEDA